MNSISRFIKNKVFFSHSVSALILWTLLCSCSNGSDLSATVQAAEPRNSAANTNMALFTDSIEANKQNSQKYSVEQIASPIENYDTYVGALPGRYRQLTQALSVPAYSPAIADENDLVVEANSLIESDPFRLVVRKPSSNGVNYEIKSIPTDPTEAWTFIQNHIEEAARLGAGKITFPPNQQIRLLNPGGERRKAHLPVEGLSDTDIDFNGSTLVYMTKGPGIVLEDCQRVTLRNGSIISPFIVASIARVEYDNSLAGMRFHLLPRFARQFGPADQLTKKKRPTIYTVGKAEAYSGSWRIAANGAEDLFTNRKKNLNRFRYKSKLIEGKLQGYFVSTSPTDYITPPYEEGQLVYLLHENNTGHAIVLKNDDGDVEDITIRDLDLKNIPGMGIVGEINRGLHVTGVSITPNKTDPTSFLGTSSDAFHINNNGGDILFENNILFGSADDFFTAKGNWWEIKEVNKSSSKLQVGNIGSKRYGVNLWANSGDRLVIADPEFRHFQISTAKDKSIEGKKRTHEVTLAGAPGIAEVGMLIANPTLSGGRMIIRNNSFSSTRAQGILAQSQHIIIENNVFENIAGPAIKINQSLSGWYEGVYTHNILVRNNSMTDVAKSAVKPPYPIYITGKTTDLINTTPLIENVGLYSNRIQ